MKVVRSAAILLLVILIGYGLLIAVSYGRPPVHPAIFFPTLVAVVVGALEVVRWFGSAAPRPGMVRRIAATGSLIAGIATLLWIIMWGFDPFTLEGAWIYPLAGFFLLVVVVLLRPPTERTGGLWDRPPGPSTAP